MKRLVLLILELVSKLGSCPFLSRSKLDVGPDVPTSRVAPEASAYASASDRVIHDTARSGVIKVFMTPLLGLLIVSGLIYVGWVGQQRVHLLESLRAGGIKTEGILFPLPVAHGSGPKPASDWGYRYQVNGASYEGYIRSRGPFRIPLGVSSLRDLAKPPLSGDSVIVTYNEGAPLQSVPFEVTPKHLSYARVVCWVVLGFGLFVGTGVLLLLYMVWVRPRPLNE